MQEVLKAEINYKINPSIQQRCPLLSDVEVRGEQEDSRMGRSPPLPAKQRLFTFMFFILGLLKSSVGKTFLLLPYFRYICYCLNCSQKL